MCFSTNFGKLSKSSYISFMRDVLRMCSGSISQIKAVKGSRTVRALQQRARNWYKRAPCQCYGGQASMSRAMVCSCNTSSKCNRSMRSGNMLQMEARVPRQCAPCSPVTSESVRKAAQQVHGLLCWPGRCSPSCLASVRGRVWVLGWPPHGFCWGNHQCCCSMCKQSQLQSSKPGPMLACVHYLRVTATHILQCVAPCNSSLGHLRP